MLPDRSANFLHFLNILESCAKIRIYSEGFNDAVEFYNSGEQIRYNACLTLLLNIGESANKLSPEIYTEYNNFDFNWEAIKGFRNRLAHNYPGLDIYIIFKTINEVIQDFEKTIYQITKAEHKKKFINEEELDAAKKSNWYRHINFSDF